MSDPADHSRVSPEGRRAGEKLSRMTDTEVGKLIAEGEWSEDERCATCAFRHGTVPNGCLQTQLDAFKAVVEKKAFGCHVARDGMPAGTHACMGWFAAVQRFKKLPEIRCPWEFSPPDSRKTEPRPDG